MKCLPLMISRMEGQKNEVEEKEEENNDVRRREKGEEGKGGGGARVAGSFFGWIQCSLAVKNNLESV